MALITLRVLDGADRGRVFEQLPTPLTIGREEGNTVQLNDERISRFHLKIQEDMEKLILTDLDSTNGTKVNGEDTQLRLLRYGDIISVGRSVLLFGSREEIAQRLAALRGVDPQAMGTIDQDEALDAARAGNLEYELNWVDNPEAAASFQARVPPELPERLSPGQSAQLCELLEYLHARIRDLLATVREKSKGKQVILQQRQWQNVVDLQSRLAEYLRTIADPPED